MSDALVQVGAGLSGTVLGFLSSFAIFRSRFTAIEKDMEHMTARYRENRTEDQRDFEKELERIRDEVNRALVLVREEVRRMCAGDDDRWRQTERRQLAMLELLADIAGAGGVVRRATRDSLTRMLADVQDEALEQRKRKVDYPDEERRE